MISRFLTLHLRNRGLYSFCQFKSLKEKFIHTLKTHGLKSKEYMEQQN